ncbi:phosphatase PAP2 family protein [Frankia gtarii]|uniref:phosphatase PAP2 family protein n=1 Tax=Frankia gtarii TaxID=2950102 RepID=UPI0021C01ADA|nr:phosphatase PAP2 family protein [Frankia gtarii]
MPSGTRGLRRGAQAAVLGFVVLAVMVDAAWSPLLDDDADVAAALGRLAATTGWLVTALQGVSAVFHPTVFRAIAVVGAAALWWRSRRGGVGRADLAATRRLALFTLVTVSGGGLLVTGFKELIGRARPSFTNPVAHAAGLSFPSGHALGAMVAAVVCLVAVRAVTGRRARWPWWVGSGVVVAVTGFARLGLGVHFLSDVLGGYLLGVGWALGMAALLRPWQSGEVAAGAAEPADSQPADSQPGDPQPGDPQPGERAHRYGDQRASPSRWRRLSIRVRN